jgi:hypothetical protein
MPLIDVKCRDCGHVFEYQRPLADYPNVPACLACASIHTEQTHLPPSSRWDVAPVVVFRTADGSYRFPGDANGRMAAHYQTLGYERVELRGAPDVRRFEKHMNQLEYSRLARRVEAQHYQKELADRERSSNVRHGLEQGFLIPETNQRGQRTGRMLRVRLGPRGRDLMHAAVRQGEARPQPRTYDTGFHVDVYSNDRSNRDESRDSSGRRRRD